MNTEEKQKSRGWIYHFFWWAAGADKDILYQCPKREHERMLSIGITVLFTAVLAFLSGYFALKTIVDNDTYVIIIAIFWGLVIFNLDRIIVMGIHKDKDNKKRKEIMKAIPRFILAGIIAVVVSKPIEVELFKKQIDFEQKEILKQRNATDRQRRGEKYDLEGKLQNIDDKEKLKEEADNKLKLGEPIYDDRYKQAVERVNTLSKDLKDKNAELRKKVQERKRLWRQIPMIEVEIKRGDSIIGTEKKRDYNSKQWRDFNELWSETFIKGNKKGTLVLEIEELEADLLEAEDNKVNINGIIQQENRDKADEAENDLKNARVEKTNAVATVKKDSLTDVTKNKAYSDGLFAKLEAFNSLAQKEKDKGNPTLYYAQFLILILFFVLEMAPALAKILHSRGPYDDIVDNQDEEYKNLKDVNLGKILDNAGIQRKMNLQKLNNEFETQTNQFAFFTERSHQLFEEMGKAHANLVSKLGELNTGFNSRYMKEIEMLMQKKFNAFKEKQTNNFSTDDAQQTYTSNDTRHTHTNNATRTQFQSQHTDHREKEINKEPASAETSNSQDNQSASYANEPFNSTKKEESQQPENNATSAEEPAPFFGNGIAASNPGDDEKNRFSFLDKIVNFFKNLFTKNNQNDE